MIGRHREHAKSFPSKMPFMFIFGVRREVCAHFPLEADLADIASRNRHRAPVDLDHEATARAVGKPKPKDKIGDESDFMHGALMRNVQRRRNFEAKLGDSSLFDGAAARTASLGYP